MDQIVVHLSINHATFPRIQSFLSHLQIGPVVPGNTVTQSGSDRSKAKLGTGSRSNGSRYAKLSQKDTNNKSGVHVGKPSTHIWSTLYVGLNNGPTKVPSISEQPLRCEQQEEIELSTIAHTGEVVVKEGTAHGVPSAAVPSLSKCANQETTEQLDGVRVRKNV